MKHIVTFTVNPTIDINARVEQVIAGRKLRCEQPRREPGGGGVNVSRAIHRLGGESVLLEGRQGCARAVQLDRRGRRRPPDGRGGRRPGFGVECSERDVGADDELRG